MRRLLSKLHLIRGVWLRDFHGRVYFSVAKRDRFDGSWWAPVYPGYNIGHCKLHMDGTICESSESSYIREWRPHWNWVKIEQDNADRAIAKSMGVSL